MKATLNNKASYAGLEQIDEERLDILTCIIMEKYYLRETKAKELIGGLCPKYRRLILDDKGECLGFIGAYNLDSKKEKASIAYDLKCPDEYFTSSDLFRDYLKYLSDKGIKTIESISGQITSVSSKSKATDLPQVINSVRKTILLKEIKPYEFDEYKEKYSLPSNIRFPFTIQSFDGLTIGVIGLTNVQRENDCADLSLFFDPELGSDAIKLLTSEAVVKYINYAHRKNFHNISFSPTRDDVELIKKMGKSGFNYIGDIPYGTIRTLKQDTDNIKAGTEILDSLLLFEAMEKHSWTYKRFFLPKDKMIPVSALPPREKLKDTIELNVAKTSNDNGEYRLVSLKLAEKEGIDVRKIFRGYIEDIFFDDSTEQDRERNEGYLILNNRNEFGGFVNYYRRDKYGYNIEMKAGILPQYQGKGLEKAIVDASYKELFSKNVATVTSEASVLCDPMYKAYEFKAICRGKRIERCYVNNELCDSKVFSVTNRNIDPDERKLMRVN